MAKDTPLSVGLPVALIWLVQSASQGGLWWRHSAGDG